MHSWEAIEKSLNYIEVHIKDELQTENLARSVGLSPFYFQHLFKRLIKKSVQEYIKLRRLAYSVEYLEHSNQRILDIALACGYSSHANFTRAFKETFGITPDEYRKKPLSLNTCIKPEIALYYTDIDEGVPLIAGDIILEITRRNLAMPEYYLGYEGEVSISGQTPAGTVSGIDVPGELWKQFHAAKVEMNQLFQSKIELGVSHSPRQKDDLFLYFTGGYIENKDVLVESDMTIFTLEPGTYIVCEIVADSFENLVTNALYQANNYLYGVWVPKHGVKTKALAAEKYFSHNEGAYSMEVWIPIK